MNRSTKYVKNQELKRFNNIKGKKRYLLISKVMNRMELSVPIILYLMFIGIVVYLMRYQGNEKIATGIDFIIAVMSVVIMVMSYIRTIITKKKNANAIWIYNGIFIYRFMISFLFVMFISLLYFIILLKINNGILHVYFFLVFFTGYMLSFVIYSKINCKRR